MPKEIVVKSVLNKVKKRDTWFLDDYTFNPYSSCSFNCLYCYIRGSKYGTNLANSLSVKTNAIELLDKQLSNRAKKGQYGYIAIASATDPYLQLEKKYELTRRALEVVLKHRFPIHLITKSDLIERDFDLIHEIDQQAILPQDLLAMKRGVSVTFSFSTIQDEVARIFEPGATRPSLRLETVRKAKAEGFKTGISFMPLIPYISDTTEQLHAAFSSFRDLKVDYIFPASITLFGSDKASSKTLMLNAIRKHYPHLAEKYDRFFGNSDYMPAYYAQAFSKKMHELTQEYGLKNSMI